MQKFVPPRSSSRPPASLLPQPPQSQRSPRLLNRPSRPSRPSRPKSMPPPSMQSRRSPIIPKLMSSSIISRKSSSPPNLSTIPEDLRLNIFKSVFNFNMVLSTKLIKNYFKTMSNISAINKGFKLSISLVRPSFKDIIIINLQNLTITKEIIDLLNLTISDQIVTIVLRSIIFDSDATFNKFLEFFNKNKNLKHLILDNIKVEYQNFEKILNILETFKNIVWLEISNTKLLHWEFNTFINILLNSKSLEYLTFTKNLVTIKYFDYLFTQNVDNIDSNSRYKIYVVKKNNNWGMEIKTLYTETVLNFFEINILNNMIVDDGRTINYRNPFADAIKFIQD